MRHLMKIISLILIISLFVTCFVFAEESETVDYSGYIKLQDILSSLDIIRTDDSFVSEYTRDITEDEFNKMLSNLTGMDYTKKCPGDFDFNRAVQKVIDLMGYDIKVKTVGPYPAGYISVATNLGILEGLKMKGSKPLSVGDAMQLLYNSLNVELLMQTIYGDNSVYEVVEHSTLLSIYKKVYFLRGVVTDNSITDFFGESVLDDGWLKIDDVKYKIDNIGYLNLLGKKVGAYYKIDEDDVKKILYIENITENADCLNVKARDIADCKDFVFTHYNNDKLNTINIRPSAIIVYNNIAARYEDAIFKPTNGGIDFIDNNSDGVFDVIIIKSYENMIVRSVNAAEMEVKDLEDNSKNISLKNMEDRYIIKTTSGERVDFDYFEEYDVLSVAKAKNNKFIEFIVSNKFASGDVTAIYFQGTDKSVKFGDKIYPVDKDYANASQDIKAGMYGTALLDFEGDIVFFVDESGNTRYGYIIAGAEKNGAFEDKMLLKLLTQDNEVTVYECNENVVIDGVTEKGVTNIKNKLFDAGSVKQQLIKYQLNKDGKICLIDMPMDVTQDTSPFTGSESLDENHLRLYGKAKTGIFLRGGNSIAAGVIITSKTKIFCVGSTGSTDESKFKVITTASMLSGVSQANYDVYTSDKECLTAEVMVTTTDLSRKGGSLAYLVTGLGRALDNEGDVVDTIFAIQDGKDVEIMVDNDYRSSVAVQVGDIVRLTFGTDGKAVARTLIYRPGNTFADLGTFNSDFYAVTGRVYNYAQGVLQITKKPVASLSLTKSPDDSTYFMDSAARMYIWDSSEQKFYTATTADLCDYKHDAAADTVMIISQHGAPAMTVIFR